MMFCLAVTMHLAQQYSADRSNQHWNVQAHDLQASYIGTSDLFTYLHPQGLCL